MLEIGPDAERIDQSHYNYVTELFKCDLLILSRADF